MTKQYQLNKIFGTLDRALRIISTTFPVNPAAKFDYPVIGEYCSLVSTPIANSLA